MVTKETNAIKLSSVEITADRLAELDGNQAIVSIQKNEIMSISLKYGICSERTILQIIFSVFLIFIGLNFGLIPTCKFFYDVYYHTEVDFGYPYGKGLFLIIFLIFFIPFGIYSILISVQKRCYLLVKTKKDKRKIVFKDKIPFHEISFFLNNAKEKYGYAIESDVNLV
jgi:hypothetical protein